ncbi:MAG: ATP-dependent protease ATPase subunit HslU [Bacteroidota bacterium]|nr:ATP-dependent protease ATPase subunit HslU [Bacteroidota bacterium]MDP4233867.1 ATP-dependent protease ATPase subunit HslU [Bacteroidota bacterium]MDP4288921.1 ATP-dependent protease ATPase subunit HslU [Bacteroidota bacterium]
MHQYTPHQIVHELDKYIIGQSNAKRSVAIALRNRWRRQQVPDALREEIMPNNIILIGPTGVGKTEIARRLARLAGAPFLKVEATKYTEVGYVGRDVESMIRDLTELAITMVKNEQMQAIEPKARANAEERILDILIPPVIEAPRTPPPMMFPGVPVSTSISGLPQARTRTPTEAKEDAELNEKTRNHYREKLRAGELDTKEIEVDIQQAPPIASMQIMGPLGGPGMDEIGQNIQDILGGMLPKKSKRRRVTVAEAREVFEGEEASKLIDMETVVHDAIERVESTGIIFLDEIDKVAGGGRKEGGGGPDVSREGVQRDLLPIVEGSNVSTRYGIVRTDHILFIASGAFHTSKPSDLIPELQGRFPIRVELESLTQNDFVKILTIPENALLKQYTALLATEGVQVTFQPDAIEAIARIAFEVNEAVENIGARRLHTILTTLLEQVLFDVPDVVKEKQMKITAAFVDERLEKVVRNRDLSQYIL